MISGVFDLSEKTLGLTSGATVKDHRCFQIFTGQTSFFFQSPRSKQIKQNKPDLEKRITFLGQLPQCKVAHHMAEATVLVAPSLSEGLGRVVFEAMACGTPVIGSRVGGIPEMIRESETGFLVPPGDVRALAGRLKWILQHPNKATQIGESARKFAREFFSEEQYVQSYSDLIEKSLS